MTLLLWRAPRTQRRRCVCLPAVPQTLSPSVHIVKASLQGMATLDNPRQTGLHDGAADSGECRDSLLYCLLPVPTLAALSIAAIIAEI